MPFSQESMAVIGLLIFAFLGWWCCVLIAIIKRRATFVVWAFWWCGLMWWLAVLITPTNAPSGVYFAGQAIFLLPLVAWPIGILARRHYSSN
jgi:hypothetical protein